MSIASDVVIQCSQIVLPNGVLGEGPFLVTVANGIFQNIQGPLTSSQLQDLLHSVAPEKLVECHLLVPGFVDIHNHGLGGASDVTEFWLNPKYSCTKLAKEGTTSVLATLTFPKNDETLIKKLVDSISAWNKNPGDGLTRVEGIHGEGPIVADLGGLVESDREMELEKFRSLIRLFNNLLKVMTIAPHVDSKVNFQRLKILEEFNVRAALGHDKQATEDEIVQALKASKMGTHFTHVFNVQNFNHRTPGLANFALVSEFPKTPEYEGIIEPTIELIGDRAHLHDLTVAMALKCKKASKIAFITDAILSGDSVNNEANYGGRVITIAQSDQGRPRVVLKGNNTLAGSCCTLLQTFSDLVNVFGVPVAQASQMCSQTPAEIANIPRVGRIEIGFRGDFLLFNQELQLKATYIAGKASPQS